MKTTFFKLITLTLFTFSFFTIKAQVNGVNYLMKYNTDSCWYDCYFVVNNGTASGIDRVAFFSQFSIVSLAGDSLVIAESYQPIETDGDTAQWNISSIVKHPAAQPANNFWSVIPTMTTAFYPELSPGDTIKLFSVRKVGTTTLCGADLRIYINGTDPSSSAAGMQGSDFSNTFTIGSAANEVYEGNGAQILGPKPKINNFDFNCSNGIEIDLTATTTECQTPLSYQWTGPAGFTTNTEDVNISSATAANNGKYWVTITDAMGCIAIDSTQAVDKPSAGFDVTDCAGTTHTIIGNPLGGTWSKISGNANVTTSNISSGVNQVVFNNLASGSYQFKYSMGSSGTCTDTMRFLINPIPSLTINDDNACVGETISNNLVGFGSGTWISNNPAIATVTAVNSTTASVTAVAAGTATFTFIRNNTNCQNTTPVFTVNANPTIVGINPLCVGSSMTLPSGSGTWLIPSTDIVTVDTTTGVVTAIAAGTTPITYTETATGCSDTENLTVITKPTINIIGNDSICIAGTTKLSANIPGTWTSNSPLIASVNNAGVVTGVAVGATTFTFTALSGCVSDPTTLVTVVPDPTASINDNRICDNTTATLSPATGGTWTSSNPSVATISGNTATAINNGSTIFRFTNVLGCYDDITLTVDPIPTVTTDNDTICITGVAQLSPTTGGTWQNTTPVIVSYNAGLKRVTGLSEGKAKLVFIETLTGCLSDTLKIEVLPNPVITFDPSDMCVGESQNLTPSSGGIWESTNNGVATVDNSGFVTTVASGIVEFRFISSLTNCASDYTGPITVKPRPVVTVPGDGVLCIGETITLTTNGSAGGTWTSSNPGVASINASTGLVTAFSAGSNVRFTYLDPNGCTSALSTPIEVKLKPTVGFLGPNPICINGITNVTSNGAVGIWASGSSAIAIVNNAGTVTGISTGSTTLTFTQTNGGCLSDPLTITVAPKPVTQFAGDTLCIGGTTTLYALPLGLGTWVSNNVGVATINSGGVVTAVGEGRTTFVFTSNNGNCPSDNSNPLLVRSSTPIDITPITVCVGTNMVLFDLPGSGIWVSSDVAVAKVVGNTIIAVAPGVATLTYYDDEGCLNPVVTQITVLPKPEVSISVDKKCVGLTSQAFPSTGGMWTSNNNAIATINNSGVITAISPGTTSFILTAVSGCSSDPTEDFIVEPGPDINYVDDSTLCIGEITRLEPSTGGTWAVAPSFSTTVATITSSGKITALGAGFTRFVFTDSTTGCRSEPSGPLTVNPKPTVFFEGSDNICMGTTTKLFPSSGGSWQSLNDSLALVDQQGVAKGLKSGKATFIFTNSSSGCVSDSIILSIHPKPNLSWNKDTIQILKTVFFKSDISVGSWKSSNSKVASINSNGVLIGKGVGKTKVSFVSEETCVSDSVSIVVNANPLIWKDLPVVFTPKNNTSQDSIVNDIALDQRVDKSINTSGSVSYYIYPNPGTGLFHISGFKGSESAVVLNAQGQLIEQCKGPLCDLTNLPSCVYLVRIMNDTKWEMHKILKQ